MRRPSRLLFKPGGLFLLFVFFSVFFFSTACPAEKAPNPLFNLAAAYRSDGAPVLAALWFRAYLETNSASSDAEAVRREIKRLDDQMEQKPRELLRLALEAAVKIPDEYWEERQRAIENAARLYALSGKIDDAVTVAKQGVRPMSRSFFQREYGEYLAAGGDEEAVTRLIGAIEDPAEANHLRETLFRTRLLRGKKDEAAEFLPQMPDSPARSQLLTQLASAYARSFDPGQVLFLLQEAANQEQRAALEALALLGELRNGNKEEALHLAQKIKEENASSALNIARVVLGEGADVFREIEASQPVQGAEWKKQSDLYQAALAALWSGDTTLAQNGYETLKKSGPSDYPVILGAYLAAENGQIEKAIESLKTLSEQTRTDLAASFFWRAVGKKDRGQIQNIISALSASPAAQGQLLVEYAKLLSFGGNDSEALNAARQAADLAVKHHSGAVLSGVLKWAAENQQQELVKALSGAERLVRWQLLSGELEKQASIRDLSKFIREKNGDDLRAVAFRLENAAGDWISAQLFIRCVEKRHRS